MENLAFRTLLTSVADYARGGYTYGNKDSDVLVVEMWASQCHFESSVRQRGIALLTVAISATILGLILEFTIRWQLVRMKSHNNSNLAKELENNERHSLDHDRRSSLHSECVLSYIQNSGNGGLLYQIRKKKEYQGRKEAEEGKECTSSQRRSMHKSTDGKLKLE